MANAHPSAPKSGHAANPSQITRVSGPPPAAVRDAIAMTALSARDTVEVFTVTGSPEEAATNVAPASRDTKAPAGVASTRKDESFGSATSRSAADRAVASSTATPGSAILAHEAPPSALRHTPRCFEAGAGCVP